MNQIKKTKLNCIIAIVISINIIVFVSIVAGQAFMPPRTEYGACWNMFYCEEKDSIDVLVLGSSVAYCDINPNIIEKETGRSTYIMAGPELTPSLSYYYLIEVLKTQTPSTVILEATGFLFNQYMDYSKVNVGYMKPSVNKLQAIINGSEIKLWPELFFPIIAYHGNQENVKLSSLLGDRIDNTKDPQRGHTVLNTSAEQIQRAIRSYKLTETELQQNAKYFQKIVKLCKNKGIELKIIIAPQAQYPSTDQITQVIGSICDNEGLVWIDYNIEKNYIKIGLDDKTDYYDFMHLNESGAVKFSMELTKIL